MAKAEPGALTRAELEHFGVIKNRCLDIMTNFGLMGLDGRPSRKRSAKGKIINAVHSTVIYEQWWLVEQLEKALGQKALLPEKFEPEDEEEAEEAE